MKRKNNTELNMTDILELLNKEEQPMFVGTVNDEEIIVMTLDYFQCLFYPRLAEVCFEEY